MKMLQAKLVEVPVMRSGVWNYPEDNECIYISNSTLQTMEKSLVGCPIVIGHEYIDNENVQKLTVGRVINAYMGADAKGDTVQYAVCLIEDERALELLINQGYGVSTGYDITKTGDAGTFNMVKYNREIIDGAYNHLAIVANPRMEIARDARILNSKEDIMVFKLFSRKEEEIKLNSDEFVKVNDTEMSLADLVAKTVPTKKLLTNETIVEVDGVKYSIADLIDKFNSCKNEEDEEENEAPAEDKEAPAEDKEESEAPIDEALAKANEVAKANGMPEPQTYHSLDSQDNYFKELFAKRSK
jgi:hypothetical protein